MNLETINVWGQLIASLGVIVSLFYVAAQVRQNTRSARAVVVDSLARSMHDLAIQMAQNDQLLMTASMFYAWLFQAIREWMVPDAPRDARSGTMGGIRRILAQRLDGANGHDLVVDETDVLRAWISELRREPQRSARCSVPHTAYKN